MKKIFVLCILMSLVYVGSAFAVAENSALLATAAQDGLSLKVSAGGEVIGKCSKGVRIGATYNQTSYALATVHLSGSKYFGTAFDSTSIFTQTPAGDIGAAFAAPATSVSATAFVSPWASL
jgi:hypothetical protein